MWIKTSENTPDQCTKVLVRFNPIWNDDECDHIYDYAVAYYEGCTFSPSGVETPIIDAKVRFIDDVKPIEWKYIQ